MKLTELYEKLNLANSNTAKNKQIHKDDDFVLIHANIEDVFKHMASGFKLDLKSETGGKNAIKNRLLGAKKHFESGEPMDPPTVGYNEYSKTIDFTDGRHRTAAAYQLGEKYIPMFVYKDHLKSFKKLVKTK